jgi:hypothetical protein
MSVRSSAGKRGRGGIDERGERVSLMKRVCLVAELVVRKVSVGCSFGWHGGSKEKKKRGMKKDRVFIRRKNRRLNGNPGTWWMIGKDSSWQSGISSGFPNIVFLV